MFNKLLKILALCVLIAGFLAGLFSIYRALIPKQHLHKTEGIVLSKTMTVLHRGRGGPNYFLVFELANLSYKIAISYPSKKQALDDFTINKITNGETYLFLIDPTYPITNNINPGIDIIEKDGKELYKRPQSLNLYGGIFIALLSLVTFIFIARNIKFVRPGC
ncbi:MAG: hypothetical protein J7539_12145 [Niabella sp.]|nr:hypothetical protein [Niabella sp.]